MFDHSWKISLQVYPFRGTSVAVGWRSVKSVGVVTGIRTVPVPQSGLRQIFREHQLTANLMLDNRSFC
jgi:hypothetical protein